MYHRPVPGCTTARIELRRGDGWLLDVCVRWARVRNGGGGRRKADGERRRLLRHCQVFGIHRMRSVKVTDTGRANATPADAHATRSPHSSLSLRHWQTMRHDPVHLVTVGEANPRRPVGNARLSVCWPLRVGSAAQNVRSVKETDTGRANATPADAHATRSPHSSLSHSALGMLHSRFWCFLAGWASYPLQLYCQTVCGGASAVSAASAAGRSGRGIPAMYQMYRDIARPRRFWV